MTFRRLGLMKRSRRSALAVLVLSLILTIGIATAAYAVTTYAMTAYIHQEGGTSSYSYAAWYVSDAPAVGVTAIGTLDLNNSEVAVWADNVDLGGVGTKALPTAIGVIMASDKSELSIDDTDIYAFGSGKFQGPQVVFATGGGTFIGLVGCTVYGDSFAAHGLYTQAGATISAEKCQIVTNRSGGGAAVATGYDGGGYITLHDCEVHSWGGDNSPAFYSSGAMFVDESKAYAHESEGAWVDGGGDLQLDWRPPAEKYGLVMYSTSLYSSKGYGVSFAKGPLAVVADDERARLAMAYGYLESAKDLFYAPNSKAHILLYHVDTYTGNGVVLNTKWSGKGPGGGVPTEAADTLPGSRESDVILESIGSKLRGDIVTDVDEFTNKESVVSFLMSDWASFQGAINSANAGTVNLTMARESVWNVTGTSYIGTLSVQTINAVNRGPFERLYFTFSPDLSSIHSNGHTVYYDSFSNPSLQFHKYALPGGGWLVPDAAVGLAGLWD
jgi:hypothetical protein